MNLNVPPELEANLRLLAGQTGRPAAELALDLLADSVEHDAWFRQEVETGRNSAREGRVLDHRDVVNKFETLFRS
jgi:predicted transcriptional regulator